MCIGTRSLCNAVILFCCFTTLPAMIQDWAVLKQSRLFHEYDGGHFIAYKYANFEEETAGVHSKVLLRIYLCRKCCFETLSEEGSIALPSNNAR